VAVYYHKLKALHESSAPKGAVLNCPRIRYVANVHISRHVCSSDSDNIFSSPIDRAICSRKYVCPKSFIVDFRMSPAVNVSGKTVALRAGSGVHALAILEIYSGL
jgi:hypothetical protein